MSPGSDTISQALDDFHQARRRAVLGGIFQPFSPVQISVCYPSMKFANSSRSRALSASGIHNIPLNAIIGSVNRYEIYPQLPALVGMLTQSRWAKIVVAANGTAGLPPCDLQDR